MLFCFGFSLGNMLPNYQLKVNTRYPLTLIECVPLLRIQWHIIFLYLFIYFKINFKTK